MTKRPKPRKERAYDLVFSRSGIVTYPPGTRLASRRLKDYEIVWFLQGNVVWEHDGIEEKVDSDCVVLSRPGTQESYTWDPQRRTQHGFFHFSIRKPIPGLPPAGQWPFVRRVGPGDALRPLLHHVAWLLAARPAEWRVVATSALHHALLMFVHDLTQTAVRESPATHPVLERALAYLERVWGDRYRNVSLAELARRAGSSPTHLSRLFRVELGVSPAYAMRVLRLQRGATLLARTNSSVLDISEMVGFATPFHFSDTFRRNFGISPREYRRQSLAGESLPTPLLGRLRELHPEVG